jgi:hypothetical protein
MRGNLAAAGVAMGAPFGLSLLQAFRGYSHRSIAWLVIGGMVVQFGTQGTKVEAYFCYAVTLMVIFVFILNVLQLYVLPSLVHLLM